MNFAHIEKQVALLSNQAPFLFKITSAGEHQSALEMMEHLIEDYDKNEMLIDMLCHTIEDYESLIYAQYNQKLAEMDTGIAVFATLMDQHKLNTSDFKNEIGDKSRVAMILNGEEPLNLGHIRKLAARFDVPARWFI